MRLSAISEIGSILPLVPTYSVAIGHVYQIVWCVFRATERGPAPYGPRRPVPLAEGSRPLAFVRLDPSKKIKTKERTNNEPPTRGRRGGLLIPLTLPGKQAKSHTEQKN